VTSTQRRAISSLVEEKGGMKVIRDQGEESKRVCKGSDEKWRWRKKLP
jgi:hypothetical protein